MLRLGAAATAAGVSKSTLSRAIKSGRMSAQRTDDGFLVDPSELFRVYPRTTTDTTAMAHHATADAAGALQAHLEGRDAQIALLRERLDEMKEERDRWRGQAERLALTQAQPITRRGLFGWLRSA